MLYGCVQPCPLISNAELPHSWRCRKEHLCRLELNSDVRKAALCSENIFRKVDLIKTITSSLGSCKLQLASSFFNRGLFMNNLLELESERPKLAAVMDWLHLGKTLLNRIIDITWLGGDESSCKDDPQEGCVIFCLKNISYWIKLQMLGGDWTWLVTLTLLACSASSSCT